MTNFPKFLRDIQLKGRSDLTKMEEKIVDTIPETLEEFFDKYPEVQGVHKKVPLPTTIPQPGKSTFFSVHPVDIYLQSF